MTFTINIYSGRLELDPYYPISFSDHYGLYNLKWVGLYHNYSQIGVF